MYNSYLYNIGGKMGTEMIKEENTKLEFMHLNEIIKNPLNKWDVQRLDDLENSILFNGLITPVTVIGPNDDGKYILIAGERRWRVFQKLHKEGKEGYDRIPTYILGTAAMGVTRQELLIEASNLDNREDIEDKQAHYLNVVRLMKRIKDEEGLNKKEYVEMRTKYMKCSDRYARFYEQVFDCGNQELQDMVSAGEISVSRAGRIATMPDHVQKNALNDIKTGMNQDEVVSKHAKIARSEKEEDSKNSDIRNTTEYKNDVCIDNHQEMVDIDSNNLELTEAKEDSCDLSTNQDEIDNLNDFDFTSINTDFLSCDSTNALGHIKNHSRISTTDELETVIKWCNKMLKENAPSEEEWEAIEACRKLVERFS